MQLKEGRVYSWLTVQERFFQPGREGSEAGLDSADCVAPTGRKERENRKWAEAAPHLRRTPGYSCSKDLPPKGSMVALMSATSREPSIQTQHRARSWSIVAKASPRTGHGEEVVLRKQGSSFPSILCVCTELSVHSVSVSLCSILTGLLMDRRGPAKDRKDQEKVFILMWHILLTPLKTQPSNQTQGDYRANIMDTSIYFLSYNQFYEVEVSNMTLGMAHLGAMFLSIFFKL